MRKMAHLREKDTVDECDDHTRIRSAEAFMTRDSVFQTPEPTTKIISGSLASPTGIILPAVERMGDTANIAQHVSLSPETPKGIFQHPSSSKAVTPPPRQASLKRSRSAPSPRRSIFSQYWNNESSALDSESVTCASLQRPKSRPRACSISVDGSYSDSQHFDIRSLSAPVKPRFQSAHFHEIRELLEVSNTGLPPVPFPLQRFYKEGQRTVLSGMFPMNTPNSILRPPSFATSKANGDKPATLPPISLPSEVGKQESNLTKSVKRLVVTDGDKPAALPPISLPSEVGKQESNLTKSVKRLVVTASEDEASACSTITSGSQTERCVRFDPRVTISEFEDDVPRLWWTPQELEELQNAAVETAREYLVTHPECIEKYSQARLDPITGTLRKMPLFSLPAFSLDDAEFSCIESILLVDPNDIILQLFRKSFREILPAAEIYTAKSGEDAWAKILEHGSFDVVVTEERLCKLKTQTSSLLKGQSQGGIMLGKDATNGLKHSSMRELKLVEGFLTGSVLLRRIQQTGKCRSLLIGVTGTPSEDSGALRMAGADLVWGKPPPKMDQKFRRELEQHLLGKSKSAKSHD